MNAREKQVGTHKWTHDFQREYLDFVLVPFINKLRLKILKMIKSYKNQILKTVLLQYYFSF